ncbi:MAG: tryptophan 2,3-dioxygenase family protein [Pacificimonas sp.]|nr:tryptophan 2,3-dioxygenase family protein [Pacificimonas sp.]
MKVGSKKERGLVVNFANIDGETIHWDDGLTYARHIQTKALLSSQVPVSSKPDEMLFIIMHQTMELWLKLLLHETCELTSQIRRSHIGKAIKTIDRMNTVIRHMTHSWEVLATLTPHDFLTFRGYLRRASGFQSHQFRVLEFMLGVKRPDMMLVHKDDPSALNALQEALQNPTLYDEILHMLAREGFDVPEAVLNRDITATYEPDDVVEDIWRSIYEKPEAHWQLYMLAEKVAEIEYYFHEWRFKHMKTVSRVIGHRPGTGGSSGVDYLVKSLKLTFFPELWTMRTKLDADKVGGDYAPGNTGDQCPA